MTDNDHIPRILIIDDEEDVLNILSELLILMGHDVSVSMEGNHAIGLFRKAIFAQKPFHAVVIDYYIGGGMNGAEILEEFRALDPNVKALLISGCMDDLTVDQHGFQGSLSKPFAISVLDEMLAGMLRKSA